MTAQFTLDEILNVTLGRLAAGMSTDDAGAICTDTRAVRDGDWYLALVGERFDGHDFLGDAFAAGACGAIVEERQGHAIGNPQFPLIAVADTLEAYHALARNWRKRINPFVVGITGSSGKTTTKEMAAAVFASTFRCHKSAQNENNEFGVPKTILTMPDDTQVLIVEMAMRGLGQIDQLARCAVPDVGVITNAGTAHLELLGTVENIAIAKAEILKYMNKTRGAAIVGQPVPRLISAIADVFDGQVLTCKDDDIEVVSVTTDRTDFRVNGEDTVFSVKAHGRPLLEDAWCVIMAARHRKMTDEQIAAGLHTFETVGGRGNRVLAREGALVLDETYNGNPDSVKASISGVLDKRAFPHQTKIVVLGELAELGPTEKELHRELGTWLRDKPVSLLITVGHLARNIAEGAQGAEFQIIACMDQSEVEEQLRSKLNSDVCLLVKGSHRANLDKLVSKLVGA